MNKIKFSVISKAFSPSMLAIYIRCEQFGKHIDIDTSVHIFNDEWNRNTELVENNPNSRQLNLFIRKTVYKLEEYELNYDGNFTLFKLKELWDGRDSFSDFYGVMEYQIAHRDIRDSTREIHRRVLVHLKKYKETCLISELDEDFVKGFIRYMKDINLNPTTICMQIRTLRCYYNIARKLFGNKVPSDTFSFYHETQEQQTHYHMQPFTDDDIKTLENFISRPTTSPSDIITLDRFLFMSYTGMRISDFISMTPSCFTMENGKMWCTYDSIKTNTHVRIPLSYMFDGRAEQMLNKYKDDFDTFFHLKKRDSFNQSLKAACRHAGITKRVSAHTARHTCATRLVNKDVPVTTIQKVIGHRTLRMTMVYARTSENTLIRQLG